MSIITKWPRVFGALTLIFQWASAQDVIWVRRFDSGFADRCVAGAVDPTGNVVVVFASALYPESDSIWTCVVKYTPSGDTLWTRIFDSDAILDEPYGLAVDNEGNIYVCGIYSYGISGGGQVLKYDPNGNLIWNKRYGGINSYDYTFFECVAVASDGIVVGGHCGYSRIPPHPDVLLVKLSPDSEQVWLRIYNYGGGFLESVHSIVITQQQQIVGVGPIGDHLSTTDYLVLKFSQNGDTLWSSRLDLDTIDYVTGLAGDSAGNIYISSWKIGEWNSWPVLLKYAPEGETLFTRVYNSVERGRAYDITIDARGNVFLIGGIDVLPEWYTNCLLMATDSNGNLLWTRQYSLDSTSWGMDLCFSGLDTLYIFGLTQDEAGDNPDMFIMKLRYSAGIEVPAEPIGRERPLRLLSPNPIPPGAPIRLFVQQPGDYRLLLYRADGRKMSQVYSGPLRAGISSISCPLLPAGMYFLLIDGGCYQETLPLVVVR